MRAEGGIKAINSAIEQFSKRVREHLEVYGHGYEMRLTGHTWAVEGVAVLGDGRIVSGGLDKTLKLWSVTDPRRHVAALQINRHWRDAIGNPERKLCRTWLARQCEV